jgi:hypothetical protein
LDLFGTRVCGIFDVAYPGEDCANGVGVEMTLPDRKLTAIHHERLYGPQTLGAAAKAMYR